MFKQPQINFKKFNHIKMPILPKLEVSTRADGVRHYTSPNGIILPSMTTILSYFKSDSINEWRDRVGHDEANKITNIAGVRGKTFHTLMENYLKNKKDLLDDIMPDMRQSFRGACTIADRIDNIRYIESQLWSENLGVAGQADIIADYMGTISVIDWKTSLKPKKEEWIQHYFEQATGYALMYEERLGQKIDQIVVIISVDNEKFPSVYVKDKTPYITSLKSKITKYQEEFGGQRVPV